MEYWMILLVLAFLDLAFTVAVLMCHGVNAENHSLFVKIVRLKAMRADATEFGNAIFSHVMTEMSRRGGGWHGNYDIRPAIGLIGERDFDDAYTVVVRRLLDSGFKPVSLDRMKGVIMLG